MVTNDLEASTPSRVPLPLRSRLTSPRRWLGIAGILKRVWIRRVGALLVLFAISSFTMLPNLGYPRAIVFDETYFIPAAQKYLTGTFFLEPHPPLGKLLIALGQYWTHPEQKADQYIAVEKIPDAWPVDQDITGYRIMPALFGMLNPLLVYAIVLLLFRCELVAFATGSFVALDNALIVQARAALLDSFLVFFILATILAVVGLMTRKRIGNLGFIGLAALAGAFAGCAANVKLSGLFVIVAGGVYGLDLLLSRRFKRTFAFAALFGSGFAIAFLGLWAIHFAIGQHLLPNNDYGISQVDRQILEGTYRPDPVTRFVIQFQDAVRYQQNYENGVPKLDLSKPEEIGSPWYWWFVGGRAIDYRWETPDGQAYRYVYLVGNPLTWLISLIGVVLGTCVVLSDLLFGFLGKDYRKWLYTFVLLYWAYMIPIMLIQRVMYLYHYLPPLVIGIILFALVVWVNRRLSLLAKWSILLVVTLLVIVGFWVVAPLTYYQPLTRDQFQQRNIWPAWDLKCVDC